MYIEKLKKHIELCRKNLITNRVKCCANCPFEDDICEIYPEMVKLFEDKRNKQKNDT